MTYSKRCLYKALNFVFLKRETGCVGQFQGTWSLLLIDTRAIKDPSECEKTNKKNGAQKFIVRSLILRNNVVPSHGVLQKGLPAVTYVMKSVPFVPVCSVYINSSFECMQGFRSLVSLHFLLLGSFYE